MSQRTADATVSTVELTDELITPAPAQPTNYSGPHDSARAESLYRSALTKPDLNHSVQLLVASLAADPEHAHALEAILERGAALTAAGRKITCEFPVSSPLETFLRAIVRYCSSQIPADAIAAAAEALRLSLLGAGASLARHVLDQVQNGQIPSRPALLLQIADVLEQSSDLEQALVAVRAAAKLAPADQTIRQREKNLLASKYLRDTNLTQAESFRSNLKDPQKQANLHQPKDPNGRIDELAAQYSQTHSAESFRDLVRLLRGSSPEKREASLPLLQDALTRFGDQQILWFIREVKLEKRWAEVRLHQQLLEENPASVQLQQEHALLRGNVLSEQIEHLYDVVGALPNTPDRHRRMLELAGYLLDASRYEQAIRQAQLLKRQSGNTLDAWLIMAKAFVQLGLTPEADECFRNIITELNGPSRGTLERILEAKHSYASFLLQQAKAKRSLTLANQARKLCSDVMVEDIEYRNIRAMCAEADALMQEIDALSSPSPSLVQG